MKNTPGLIFCLLLASFFARGQNDINNTFRSKMSFPGQTLANVWGYWSEGKEYALVGGSQGMIVVDITNPDTPQQIVQIPGPNSLWKEIKTYGHYAYIVSEGGMGLQIVDLSPLPSPNLPYHSYYGDGLIEGQLNKAHALHVDVTTGFLYLYGSNLNSGTAIYVNLNPDPYNPTYAGKYPGIGYVHDGYVDNDTMYSCHIYQGQMAMVDVRDKLNPVLLGSVVTPGAFTHNSWLSTDHKTAFTTDEVNGSFLAAYDISDPSDIRFLDKTQSNPGSGSIAHNTEILGDFAVTSWYRDGYTIVDVSRPDNLVQVGNFDTYGGGGSGFQGCWGVYPYFPSGTIIASNISAPGTSNNGELYLVTPQYVHACHLEGTVSAAGTGTAIDNASVVLNSSSPLNENSNAAGIFKMGQLESGSFNLQVNKNGFQPFNAEVALNNGQLTQIEVVLFPEGPISISGQVLRESDDTPVPFPTVVLYGATAKYTVFGDEQGNFIFNDVLPGYYDMSAAKLGYGKVKNYHLTLANSDSNLQLKVHPAAMRPAATKTIRP